MEKKFSLSGNWTPVSRVTGGDTYHYTNKDSCLKADKIYIIIYLKLHIAFEEVVKKFK